MEKILIVDDEKSILNSLEKILTDEGYSVKVCESGEEAINLVKSESFDVIFLDIWLKGMDGVETLKILKENKFEGEVIIISGHGTIELAVKTTKLGAFSFIEKPLSIEKILVTLKNAIEKIKLKRENRELKNKIFEKDELIGNSVPIKALKREIEIVAPTDSRVLIYGENGTGKELVARLIHRKSLRSNKPFVEINCAAIPDELIESELFGYKKGAFTGATNDKPGKFELANYGTLFLDEIGDMSIKTQAKLLRVLEEEKIEPLGGTKQIEINTRIISATNKNLMEEIEKGNFREDLFYRLNVIPIEIVPLRERKEDIPLLVKYFLSKLEIKYKKGKMEFSDNAIEKLMDYSWPGNVRELKNVVERTYLMAQSEIIKGEDIFLNTKQNGEKISSFLEAKQKFERDFIKNKLKENNYNVAITAKKLKIDKSSLYKKIKNLGIKLPEK